MILLKCFCVEQGFTRGIIIPVTGENAFGVEKYRTKIHTIEIDGFKIRLVMKMKHKSSTRGYVEASYKFTKESYLSGLKIMIEDLQTHVKQVEKDCFYMMPLTGINISGLLMNYGRLEELRETKRCLDGDKIE